MQGLSFVQKLCQDIPDIDISNFLFEPLIEIHQRKVILPDLDIYDGVIVTSRHGKCALPENYKCYSVGDYAPTARALTKRIIDENQNKKLHLLYLRAKDISFDMKSELENSGHEVDELMSYEAVANYKFSSEFLVALRNNEISAITFFSKRTAEIFIKSVHKYKIIDDLKEINLLCISDSVLECLNSIFENNIEASSRNDAIGVANIVIDYCKRYKL